jgi:hypothetical protein
MDRSHERLPRPKDREAFVRNIAEVPWLEYRNHFGGALSKPLVTPDSARSQHSTIVSPATSRRPTLRGTHTRLRNRSKCSKARV